MEFDQVIANNILLYIHPSEWKVNKPHLISNKFLSVIRHSEHFAREYLCELFGSMDDELEQMDALIHGSVLQQVRVVAEPHQKKRKIDDLFIVDESLKGWPTSFRQVFRWYIKYNDFALRNKSKETILRLMERDEFEFNELYQILDTLKARRMIESNFDNLRKECDIRTMELGDSFIDNDEIDCIFRDLTRDLFILNHKTETNMLELKETTWTKCLIWTNCGYPLLVEARFTHHYHEYSRSRMRSETVTVYGQELFSHTCISDMQEFVSSHVQEINNERLFDTLAYILTYDCDKILKDGGILSSERKIVKFTLVYNYLKCCLGENCNDMMKYNESWCPFSTFETDTIDSDEEDE